MAVAHRSGDHAGTRNIQPAISARYPELLKRRLHTVIIAPTRRLHCRRLTWSRPVGTRRGWLPGMAGGRWHDKAAGPGGGRAHGAVAGPRAGQWEHAGGLP